MSASCKSTSSMPTDLVFRQQWQRIVFTPSGEHVERLDSGWYDEAEDGEAIARSMLNDEWPGPTKTGWFHQLRTRWVSEHRPVDEATA